MKWIEAGYLDWDCGDYSFSCLRATHNPRIKCWVIARSSNTSFTFYVDSIAEGFKKAEEWIKENDFVYYLKYYEA